MKLNLSTTNLNRKTTFITLTHSVSTHKQYRIQALEVFYIVENYIRICIVSFPMYGTAISFKTYIASFNVYLNLFGFGILKSIFQSFLKPIQNTRFLS